MYASTLYYKLVYLHMKPCSHTKTHNLLTSLCADLSPLDPSTASAPLWTQHIQPEQKNSDTEIKIFHGQLKPWWDKAFRWYMLEKAVLSDVKCLQHIMCLCAYQPKRRNIYYEIHSIFYWPLLHPRWPIWVPVYPSIDFWILPSLEPLEASYQSAFPLQSQEP